MGARAGRAAGRGRARRYRAPTCRSTRQASLTCSSCDGVAPFLRWSEDQAKAAGLTGAKHQLLLAIQGHPDPAGPTIGELAGDLVLRHHSAVGLVDRAVMLWRQLERAPDGEPPHPAARHPRAVSAG